MKLPVIGLAALALCANVNAGTATYTYDALGRLTDVAYDNSVHVDYVLDAAGNWLSVAIATPPSAPPTITASMIGAGSVTFTFTPPSFYTGAVITGYVATCQPGGLTASVGANATSVTVTGLVRGTSYTCTVAGNSAIGLGPPSTVQAVVGGAQTIAFGTPAPVWIGLNRAVPVAASSGLAVTLTSTTPATCTMVSGTTVRGVASGNCTLNATQPGDANFLAATPVTATLRVLSPAILNILFGNGD